jgi:vacuolar-type H+-ATPase subunit F/Vma7
MIMCPKCRHWEIKEDDRFCAWCRLKLLDLEIAPGKMRFYIDKEKGKCRHKNKIRFNNKGWTEVKGVAIVFDKSIFSISPGIDSLKQGENKEVTVEIPDAENVKLGTAKTIMIEIGGEKRYIEAEAYYTPEWTLILDGETVKPLDRNQPFKLYKFSPGSRVKFRLEFSGITVFEVEELVVENVEGVQRYTVETKEIGDDFIEGILKIDNEKLTIGMAEFISLGIRARYSEFAARVSFYVRLVMPPSFYLMIDGVPYKGQLVEVDVYEGIKNEKEIRIINSSEETLTIEAVTLQPPFTMEEPGLEFPRQLPPGSDESLVLNLEADAVADNKMAASVTLHTREISDETLRFLIEKKEAKEFTGAMAFDFGTTNTTVAYRSRGNTRFIPLEKINVKDPDIAASVIRYERIINEKPVKYVVGELAKSLMIRNPESSVMSIKTRLGEKKKMKILPVEENTGSTAFTPLEITSHIIKRLKENVESHLKEIVTKAVITHPSKFTHIQIEELKAAFQLAGIDAFEAVEEPEAAALNYILKEREEDGNSYIIGVFDCGGGTTDITMIEVEETKSKGNRVIDVKVLATDGHRNFGGNNFTDMMIDIIEEKINNLDFDVDCDDKQALKKKFYFREEAETDEKMIKIMTPRGIDWELEVRKNRTEMWRNAEDWKIRLSAADKVEATMSLQFVKDDNLVPFTVGFKIEKTEFEKRIDEKIVELVDKLKRMSEKTGKDFDLILLSGMSSQIPRIYEVFHENFGDIIKYAKDLKKCVVLGALKFYEMKYLPGPVDLNFDEGIKLRSAMGVLSPEDMYKTKFVEVFPQGTQIATEWEKINLRLKRKMVIAVYINTGTREYYNEAPDEFEELGTFRINVPGNITEEQIREGELCMKVEEDLKPKVYIKTGEFFKEFSVNF